MSTRTDTTNRHHLARTIGAAMIASLISLAAVGAGSAHAGSISPGGDYRMGAGLRCGHGQISADMPVVSANNAGAAWQISQLWQFSGSQWAPIAWSGYRYAQIGAGNTNEGNWVEYSSGQLAPVDSFSVTSGFYYAILQYAYVDGAWVAQLPVTAGQYGIGTVNYCAA